MVWVAACGCIDERKGLPQRTFQLWVGDGVRWFESGYDSRRTQFVSLLRGALEAVTFASESRTPST